MLAQLVEQRTFNPLVASSNLAHPTKSLVNTGMPAALLIAGIFVLGVSQGPG